MTTDRVFFENIYAKWNKPEYIHPDPLEFIGKYENAADKETVGFIAACMAYGNVTQILAHLETALSPLGDRPADFLKNAADSELKNIYASFRYRFTDGEQLSLFMTDIKYALISAGSLENMFKAGDDGDITVKNALKKFLRAFNSHGRAVSLTPDPELDSSFKRVNLFLRWMVRKDNVDPGIWRGIPTSRLIVPLDTHMRQTAISLGMTVRKDTGMKTALEITEFFRKINPEDPIKYDFSLTRSGIRGNNPV